MPTAPRLDFFFLVLKCGIRVVLKPSGVESVKQSPRGSSLLAASQLTTALLAAVKFTTSQLTTAY